MGFYFITLFFKFLLQEIIFIKLDNSVFLKSVFLLSESSCKILILFFINKPIISESKKKGPLYRTY